MTHASTSPGLTFWRGTRWGMPKGPVDRLSRLHVQSNPHSDLGSRFLDSPLRFGSWAHLCERVGESINFSRGKLTLRPFLKQRLRNSLRESIPMQSSTTSPKRPKVKFMHVQRDEFSCEAKRPAQRDKGREGMQPVNFSQHGPTTRPSVERTAEKAFLLPDRV